MDNTVKTSLQTGSNRKVKSKQQKLTSTCSMLKQDQTFVNTFTPASSYASRSKAQESVKVKVNGKTSEDDFEEDGSYLATSFSTTDLEQEDEDEADGDDEFNEQEDFEEESKLNNIYQIISDSNKPSPISNQNTSYSSKLKSSCSSLISTSSKLKPTKKSKQNNNLHSSSMSSTNDTLTRNFNIEVNKFSNNFDLFLSTLNESDKQAHSKYFIYVILRKLIKLKSCLKQNDCYLLNLFNQIENTSDYLMDWLIENNYNLNENESDLIKKKSSNSRSSNRNNLLSSLSLLSNKQTSSSTSMSLSATNNTSTQNLIQEKFTPTKSFNNNNRNKNQKMSEKV